MHLVIQTKLRVSAMCQAHYFTVRITVLTYHPPWRLGLGLQGLTGCCKLHNPTGLAVTQSMLSHNHHIWLLNCPLSLPRKDRKSYKYYCYCHIFIFLADRKVSECYFKTQSEGFKILFSDPLPSKCCQLFFQFKIEYYVKKMLNGQLRL